MLLEVGLIGIHHAIQPWQQLLRAVIGVENDGDTIGGCDCADIMRGCNGSGNRGFLVLVADALLSVNPVSRKISRSHHLAGKVCSTTLRCLEDDRSFGVAGSFEGSDDG